MILITITLKHHTAALSGTDYASITTGSNYKMKSFTPSNNHNESMLYKHSLTFLHLESKHCPTIEPTTARYKKPSLALNKISLSSSFAGTDSTANLISYSWGF